MKKRLLSCLLAALLLVTLAPVPAKAVDTSATAAYMVDANTGRVFYEKNPDKQMLIASTTKIMTALVAVRRGNLADVVTVSKYAANTEGSSMNLKAGEKLTLEALLYGLLMRSGNDAAVAIAQHVGGSEAAFVAWMNATAKELGMTNSSFANPHGLNKTGHYSTARDMATLAKAAMENETVRRITSTKKITIGGRTMENQNKLLGLVEGCIGLKTGWTRAAGRTLVSCAERNGHRLICVTLQDGNDWVDHQTLYKYAFGIYQQEDESAAAKAATEAAAKAKAEAEAAAKAAAIAKAEAEAAKIRTKLASDGEYFGEMPIEGGRWTTVALAALGDFYAPVPAGAKVSVVTTLAPKLTAPVQAGDEAGQAVYYVDGKEVGRVSIVCMTNVPAVSSAAVSSLKLGLPK